MCGIAGIWKSNSNLNVNKAIERMTAVISHRGPNDYGQWIDESINLALGHRRLSIMDLTEAGHQPMLSSSERWVIVYNGEIYNFEELRNEIIKTSSLKGNPIRFRGSCDTEVILEAVEVFGPEAAIKKMVGMFAMALFDRKENELYLFRDRMGEKPLYYGIVAGAFAFSSELKSIYTIPGFSNEIDRNALSLYFRYNYIPAPFTIYKNLYKLEQGCCIKIANPLQKLPKPKPYWSVFETIENNVSFMRKDESEIIEEIEKLLRLSISQQMEADVPLGAFLSGGIDSSLIVALMQDINSTPINTFSIGFFEKGYNEAEEAKKVAKHLGTNHTELYVTSKQAMDVIPSLPKMYDEPFSDSSQIPTFLVSQLAKSKVTVCLSGDAGDELFGGYNRYLLANNIWNNIEKVPKGMRRLVSGGIKHTSPHVLNYLYGFIRGIFPSKYQFELMGDKLHKLAEVLDKQDILNLYLSLISHNKEPDKLVLKSVEPETAFSNGMINSLFDNKISMMMGLDMVTYLPDDILVKVDRAAMHVSLETRVPFLDHRIVECALKVPTETKIKDGVTKWPLRQILYKYIPKELIERPKMGFGIPVGDWLTGDLREWVEALLDERKLKAEGFLNTEIVKKLWFEHLEGRCNWQYQLWDILMFEMWLQEYHKV